MADTDIGHVTHVEFSATGRTRDLVTSGSLDLPLPGHGQTARRWRTLATIARQDVVVGRLVEAHADAVAILAELGSPPPPPDSLWGVWAADPPSGRVRATRGAAGWQLSGTKEWCSGASGCTHALVSAHADDGYRLFAVDLTSRRADGSVAAVPGTWPAVGMARSDSRSVTFGDAAASAVGGPDDYLQRPGFWQGAVGVAAAWYGAARGVADRLWVSHHQRPLHSHALAHAGAVEADLRAARAVLLGSAADIDADPDDTTGQGMVSALAVRATVESVASRTLDHVGRALGPVPLARDGDHAARVADLVVYVRQSHAERDLESLAVALAGMKRADW